jgi:hypothetical protein
MGALLDCVLHDSFLDLVAVRVLNPRLVTDGSQAVDKPKCVLRIVRMYLRWSARTLCLHNHIHTSPFTLSSRTIFPRKMPDLLRYRLRKVRRLSVFRGHHRRLRRRLGHVLIEFCLRSAGHPSNRSCKNLVEGLTPLNVFTMPHGIVVDAALTFFTRPSNGNGGRL